MLIQRQRRREKVVQPAPVWRRLAACIVVQIADYEWGQLAVRRHLSNCVQQSRRVDRVRRPAVYDDDPKAAPHLVGREELEVLPSPRGDVRYLTPLERVQQNAAAIPPGAGKITRTVLGAIPRWGCASRGNVSPGPSSIRPGDDHKSRGPGLGT